LRAEIAQNAAPVAIPIASNEIAATDAGTALVENSASPAEVALRWLHCDELAQDDRPPLDLPPLLPQPIGRRHELLRRWLCSSRGEVVQSLVELTAAAGAQLDAGVPDDLPIDPAAPVGTPARAAAVVCALPWSAALGDAWSAVWSRCDGEGAASSDALLCALGFSSDQSGSRAYAEAMCNWKYNGNRNRTFQRCQALAKNANAAWAAEVSTRESPRLTRAVTALLARRPLDPASWHALAEDFVRLHYTGDQISLAPRFDARPARAPGSPSRCASPLSSELLARLRRSIGKRPDFEGSLEEALGVRATLGDKEGAGWIVSLCYQREGLDEEARERSGTSLYWFRWEASSTGSGRDDSYPSWSRGG
jgi:hypothetical protein